VRGLLLDERERVSYPDGVEDDDGTIYVIYDRQRTTEREILMATFTEADVQQGRCMTESCRLKVVVSKAGPPSVPKPPTRLNATLTLRQQVGKIKDTL